MFKELKKIIKDISGNILAISIDDKLLNYLKDNDNINLYSISDNRKSVGIIKGKKCKRKNNKGKNINIKKLRKYISDDSVDYLFCNMNSMIDYYKYFIRDSIYLSRGMIYIYSSNDIDKAFIIDKYKRYNAKIEYKKYKDGYLLIINTENTNNSKIKNKLYYIKDTLYNIAEFIGNLLVN